MHRKKTCVINIYFFYVFVFFFNDYCRAAKKNWKFKKINQKMESKLFFSKLKREQQCVQTLSKQKKNIATSPRACPKIWGNAANRNRSFASQHKNETIEFGSRHTVRRLCVLSPTVDCWMHRCVQMFYVYRKLGMDVRWLYCEPLKRFLSLCFWRVCMSAMCGVLMRWLSHPEKNRSGKISFFL